MAEPNDDPTDTKLGTAVMVVFVIVLIFCSMEVVPGWGLFNLGWPPIVFYVIMAVCGAIAGAVYGKMRVIGAVCGVISGVGAIGLTQILLENVQRIPSKAIALVAMIGAIPGFLLYIIAAKILSPKEPSDTMETPDNDQPT